jgi:hypothetical protein
LGSLSAAAARVKHESSIPPARTLLIAGSIISSHPLAGIMDPLYRDHPRIAYQLDDGRLHSFLLRPNSVLTEWIHQVTKQFQQDRPDNYVATIGMQIRTGYADAADVSRRPHNANFLAVGDEELFLMRLENLLKSNRFGGDTRRMRVFLATDSPIVRTNIEHSLQNSERFNSGIQLISVTRGSVVHCGPSRETTKDGVLRMLTEWFILARHTDITLITAWSLFGSSAVEGKQEKNIYRIDASNCERNGIRGCQMRKQET